MRPFRQWYDAWVWGKAPEGWQQVGAVRRYTFRGWVLEFTRNRKLSSSFWGIGLVLSAKDYNLWLRLGRTRVSVQLFRVS